LDGGVPSADDVTSSNPIGEDAQHSGVAFATTRWSVVLTAQSKSPAAQEALEKLCRDPWIQNRLAMIKLAQGDPVAAQSLLEQVPLEFSPHAYIWGTRFTAALYLRDYDAANRVIAATPEKWREIFGEETSGWAYGQVARARGDKEKTAAAFAATRNKLEAKLTENPNDAPHLSDAAKLDAGLGRKEEAI
jgi:hypothetical protein